MNRKFKINYIVKPENSLVVCIISGPDTRSSGVARCHPDDIFNEDLGKEIARRRAIIKYKKMCLVYCRENLEYVHDCKRKLEGEERYFENRIRKIKESIGKISTEIDNVIKMYSK